jgi:Caspase domain
MAETVRFKFQAIIRHHATLEIAHGLLMPLAVRCSSKPFVLHNLKRGLSCFLKFIILMELPRFGPASSRVRLHRALSVYIEAVCSVGGGRAQHAVDSQGSWGPAADCPPLATREALVEALRKFAEEAEKADWAMIYYAGHGMEMNGVNYLIPVDAKLAADRDLQFEAVPLDQLLISVEGARKLKLILLDACRDNPFAPTMRRTATPEIVATGRSPGATMGTRSIGRGLGEVKVSGATLVVFAAKNGQTALDGEGRNSPFAIAVTQRIATPEVEITKVFRLVRDDVMEATAGRQEPYTYGSLPGKNHLLF